MLVVAVLVLVPLVLILIFQVKKTLFPGSGKLPPGPNALQILRKASTLSNKPHIAIIDLARIYGPLMSLRLGSRVVIVASSASTAREILQTQDRNFSGRFMPLAAYQIPGAKEASIVLSKKCNDTWKLSRGICQDSIFSSRWIESQAGTRKAKVVEMVTYLQGKQGRVIQLDDVIDSTMHNIISHMLVSRNIYDMWRGDENDEKIRAAVRQAVDRSLSCLVLPDLFPFLRKIDHVSIKWKASRVYTKMVSVWKDVVKQRRSSRNNASNTSADFLDVLLDNALTDDQIYMLLMEILVGGADSSASTSTWLIVELIKNPQILSRVRDEVAGAFDDDMMMINESILTESKYLQACIKETLRFHNPGPLLLPHRAIETCKIGNYVIPKDSMVLVNAGYIGVDPEIWKDAEKFDPDRFIDSKRDCRGIGRFEFIPFGAGRRMCPGYNVGFKNIQIVVASLVHCFDWSFPDGMDASGIDMSDKFEVFVKKEKPLHMIPTCVC